MDDEQVLSRLFGKHCPEGAVLYAEGSPGEELFLVRGGAIRLVPARGGEREGETCGPGQILGEEAFFGRVARGGRAEAMQDSRLLRVSDRTLDTVARHGPEVARIVAERLLELAGAAASRLEAWALSRGVLRAQPHLRTAAPLPAEELAERSGLPVSVARTVLEALAARGALVRDPGGYRITDTAALERAVQAIGATAP